MATRDEWQEFCDQHAELYALDTTADAVMLRAWWPLLGSYELAELIEASRFIGGFESASRKREHCGLIAARIRAMRRQREQGWSEAGWREAQSECHRKCEGGGHYVPHPRGVVNGAWVPPYYTCFVFCLCPLGLSKKSKMWATHQGSEGKIPAPQDIADYEQRVPNWAELLADRENGRKDQAREQEISAEADKARPISLADVQRRLGAAFKTPGPK